MSDHAQEDAMIEAATVSRRRMMRLGAASAVGGLAAAGVVASASPAGAEEPNDWHVVNPGGSIQNALNDAENAGGGIVYLEAGVHPVTSKLTMGENIILRGAGANTVLETRANIGWVIELKPRSQGSAIEDLRIFGLANSYNAGGIRVNTQGPSLFSGSDSYVSLRNLFIHNTRKQGVLVENGTREARMHNVVVLSSRDEHCIEFNGVDSILSDCTAASAGNGHAGPTAHGFLIGGGNNRLTGCKAFYNAGSGFHISGNRGQLSACQAQDNYVDGIRLDNAQDVALSACCADSNQWVGLRIRNSAAVTCDSFSSFSRNGVEFTQNYGIRLQNSTHSRVTGVSRNNNTQLHVDGASAPTCDASGVIEA